MFYDFLLICMDLRS